MDYDVFCPNAQYSLEIDDYNFFHTVRCFYYFESKAAYSCYSKTDYKRQ